MDKVVVLRLSQKLYGEQGKMYRTDDIKEHPIKASPKLCSGDTNNFIDLTKFWR